MKLLVPMAMMLATALAWAGPVTSSTALPVNTGQFIFRSQAR